MANEATTTTDFSRDAAALVKHIRKSLAIHTALFDRVLQGSAPPTKLAEWLEDVGNRYLDLSERVSETCRSSTG